MIAARLRLAVLPLSLAAFLAPVFIPGAGAAAAPCQFKLGFKALHDGLGSRVGVCLDDEAYNANGDSVQHAAGGLLAWRHADNWTAFTDGYHTWVNGPNGIQERLNTERFSWEGDQQSGENTSVSSSYTSTSTVSSSGSGDTSSSISVTSSNNCSAVAHSGSASAVGLNASTVITGGSGDTTVVNNHSSSSSTPGVATTGC